MGSQGWLKGLWPVAVGSTLALFAANLWLGDLNQDEGWYLYAGGLVAEGRLPFIDFATTQGPVMSLTYALAAPLVKAWGVAGGRLFTAGLGLLGLGLCAGLATRLAGARGLGREGRAAAALLTVTLAGVNVYQAYFLTIVKTYSLCVVFLALGFLALSAARGRRTAAGACLAGALFALAAGTRLSAGAALPAVWACLLWAAWRAPEREARHRLISAALGLTLGATLGAAAAFGPFFVKAPEATWFGLVEYHAGRRAGSLFTTLAYKAGFAVRLIQGYCAPLAALALVLLHRVGAPEGAGDRHSRLPARGSASPRAAGSAAAADGLPLPVVPALWFSVLAITLLHFAAPFPYEDYQVMVFPLFAVALAVLLAAAACGAAGEGGGVGGRPPTGVAGWVQAGVVAACLLGAAASPLVPQWFVGERDRIWWPLKRQSPLALLRQTARQVRALAGPGGELLTQDPYLAVEAGLRLPRGLELGQFSYFPGLTREQALSRHVLNRELFVELLQNTTAPVAAFSGYGFAIQSPAIEPVPQADYERFWGLVRARYDECLEVPQFGQAATRLRILVRRK